MLKNFGMLVLIWGIILIINIVRCINYEPPIFYRYIIEDEHTATYQCWGYSVDVSTRSGGIICTKMNLFKTKLFETKVLKERLHYYEYNGIKYEY